MNYTLRADSHSSGSHIGVYAHAGCFGRDKTHISIIYKMIERSGGIATTSHTCNHCVGTVASGMLQQLGFHLPADYRLKVGYHTRIWVGPNSRTYHVETLGMTAPVAYRLVGSILKGLVTRLYGYDTSTKHLHALHIGFLTHDIGSPHEDCAVHPHKRTHRGCSHTMLSGTGLGDNMLFAHAACKEC